MYMLDLLDPTQVSLGPNTSPNPSLPNKKTSLTAILHAPAIGSLGHTAPLGSLPVQVHLDLLDSTQVLILPYQIKNELDIH